MSGSKFNNKKGFTLIEAIIVVAIIGLISAMAIPSYKSYVMKARVGSAVYTLQSYAKKIESHYVDYGSFTKYGANTTAVLLDTLTGDQLISSIYYYRDGNNLRIYPEFVSGAIDISGITTPRIYLYAQIDTTNETLTWICGYDAGATSRIPDNYLPSNCQTEIVPAMF